jgi:hypothetical protein
LPAESGRLAEAIALLGPPVLKLKLSALAGTATANTLLARIAETKKRDVITTTSFNRLIPNLDPSTQEPCTVLRQIAFLRFRGAILCVGYL